MVVVISFVAIGCIIKGGGVLPLKHKIIALRGSEAQAKTSEKSKLVKTKTVSKKKVYSSKK
jgi:hypothetical protein